jgi:hypothetical protein
LLAGDDYERCARSRSMKLRRHVQTGGEQLFDLELDPGETENVLGQPRYALEEAYLRAALDSYRDDRPRALIPLEASFGSEIELTRSRDG